MSPLIAGATAASGDPDNTGYTRFLVSPGIAVSVNTWKLYADVEVPFYQNVNGNQLVATVGTQVDRQL